MRYLLDTHVWLWSVTAAAKRVSTHFFAEIEAWQKSQTVFISPFSCWEIGLLVSKNQLRLNLPIDDLWRIDTAPDRLGIAQLSPDILIESTRLPGKIHGDPADRILVATAREYHMTLVTSDKLLLDYAKQGHVKARRP